MRMYKGISYSACLQTFQSGKQHQGFLQSYWRDNIRININDTVIQFGLLKCFGLKRKYSV